nr:MAG TPA: hypothetical protein [Caudoviricetes sp.]
MHSATIKKKINKKNCVELLTIRLRSAIIITEIA